MKDAVKSGWQVRLLGQVVNLNYGKALARSERDPNGSIPVYGANGVMDWSEHTLAEGPSLVIGRKGSAGEVTRVDGPFWPSDVTYYTTHDHDALDFDFLHYTLQTLNLPSMARGVKPGINRNDVYALPIPLPPLEEQRRIVAILDEAFEGLDRARENAEVNLQNARELFESFLAKRIEQDAITFGTNPIEEVAIHVTDGDHAAPPKSKEGVPFITISNVKKDTNEIDFSNTFFVPISYFEKLKDSRRPRKGDVLYTVTGSFGIPVLVDGSRDFCFQRHIGIIRPKPDLSSDWLFFCLMSPFVFSQAHAGATGTAQRTVSLKLLRSLLIPDTPYEMQQRQVEEFSRMWSEANSLGDCYKKQIRDLEELRQSLLQKAFGGELL